MDKRHDMSPLSNFHHVGSIVKDVDKTASYYESLGLGPFEPLIVKGVKT